MHPLIERHLDYDKSRITVIDPKDEGRKAHCEKHNVRFIQKGVTKDNYREELGPQLISTNGILIFSIDQTPAVVRDARSGAELLQTTPGQPKELMLPPGTHTLLIVAPGYQVLTTNLLSVSKRKIPVSVRLPAVRSGRSPRVLGRGPQKASRDARGAQRGGGALSALAVQGLLLRLDPLFRHGEDCRRVAPGAVNRRADAHRHLARVLQE